MHLCVRTYKKQPVIQRKTIKRKERVIKVDNQREVMHEKMWEVNKLMK